MMTNQANLTQPDPDLGNKIMSTPDGMAFWSGTGPKGKTCRECEHWDGGDRNQNDGSLNDARCAQYARMMCSILFSSNAPYYEISHQTKSCKYFAQAVNPPRHIEVSNINDGWRYRVSSHEYSETFETPRAAVMAALNGNSEKA